MRRHNESRKGYQNGKVADSVSLYGLARQSEKINKAWFDTKREAEQWYREFSAKKQQSINMLFSDFVEIYLKDRKLDFVSIR